MDSTRRWEERRKDLDLVLKCLFALGVVGCVGMVLVSVVMVKTTYERHQLVDRMAWSIAELEVTLKRKEMAQREAALNATLVGSNRQAKKGQGDRMINILRSLTGKGKTEGAKQPYQEVPEGSGPKDAEAFKARVGQLTSGGEPLALGERLEDGAVYDEVWKALQEYWGAMGEACFDSSRFIRMLEFSGVGKDKEGARWTERVYGGRSDGGWPRPKDIPEGVVHAQVKLQAWLSNARILGDFYGTRDTRDVYMTVLHDGWNGWKVEALGMPDAAGEGRYEKRLECAHKEGLADEQAAVMGVLMEMTREGQEALEKEAEQAGRKVRGEGSKG